MEADGGKNAAITFHPSFVTSVFMKFSVNMGSAVTLTICTRLCTTFSAIKTKFSQFMHLNFTWKIRYNIL